MRPIARSRVPSASESAVVVASGLFAIALSAAGCRQEPAGSGHRCTRNSECGAPLVCRLDRCRRECNTTRDCAPGLTCLLDAAGLGACQLPADTSCVLASDCASPLVCRFEQCVNVCEADVDCPAGSRCTADVNDRRACIDTSAKPCVHHDECAATGQVCALDGRCRDECVNHRDCRFGTLCCPADLACHTEAECEMVVPRDMGPPDIGLRDSGTADAGAPDAGPSGWPTEMFGVSCAGDVTCGIETTSQRVFCWGRNDLGQLGRGTTTMLEREPAPVLAGFGDRDSGGGAHHLLCSADACCAVSGPNQLWCWGRVPDPVTGEPMDAATPVLIEPLTLLPSVFISAIRAGTICAETGGDSYCWGDNTYGQLGDGTTMTPRGIGMIPEVFNVQLGDGFACGRSFGDGSTVCWGRNDEGQLGRNTTSANEPMPGPPIEDSLQNFSLGRAHGCAMANGGGLFTLCWGSGDQGQIGDGAFVDRPQAVSSGAPGGSAHACGGDMCCSGVGTELTCWGTGPLGSPGMTMSGVPVPVTPPASGDAIAAHCIGRAHACALGGDSSTRVYCWGDNSFGQLGMWPGGSSDVPVEAVAAP